MKKEARLRCCFARGSYSAGVVVMTVAQDDGFGVGQAETQLEGVVQEQIALAGVEQEAAGADLEVEGQRPCSASKPRAWTLFSTRVVTTIVSFIALHEFGRSDRLDATFLLELGLEEVERRLGLV